MDFVFRRSYRGSVKGLVLDWAGTTVDFGSFASMAVFIKLFAGRGFYRAFGDISRLIPAAEKKFAVEFVKLRTTELGDETHEIFAREHRSDG